MINSREKFEIAKKEVIDCLADKGLEFVYIACCGSDNYRLADEKSDMDVKVIAVPSLHSIIFNSKPVSETWNFKWGQADIKDIRLMCDNWMGQSMNFLEILFTDYFYINPNYFAAMLILLTHREEIARIDERRNIRAILGMQKQKYHTLKYLVPNRDGEIGRYGSKQLSHILHLYNFATKYIEGKTYRECLIPTGAVAECIKAIKTEHYTPHARIAKMIAHEYIEKTNELYQNYKEKARVCEEGIAALDEFRCSIIKEVLRKEFVEE